MISNRCTRKSLVTNCNSIISKNYLRFLVDSNDKIFCSNFFNNLIIKFATGLYRLKYGHSYPKDINTPILPNRTKRLNNYPA